MKSFFKNFFLVSFCFLSACQAGHRIMTEDLFYEIEEGTPKEELIKKAGNPYSKKSLHNQDEEYEYVERIKEAERDIEIRRYYFIIKDGKIYCKKMKKEDMPYNPIDDRNSYDLQTSKNEK